VKNAHSLTRGLPTTRAYGPGWIDVVLHCAEVLVNQYQNEKRALYPVAASVRKVRGA
jgi:hypothetical protein